MNSFDDKSNEAFFFNKEVSRVFKEKKYVEDGSSGFNKNRWELMVLEGTRPLLRIERVGKG